MSPLSIILLFFSEKVSNLNQERNLHRSNSVYEENQSKTIMYFDVRGDGLFYWRKRYYYNV